MAKTFTAPFAQTPKCVTAVCTAANTTLTDSPDDTVLLVTAGADGSIVTRIDATPRATVTAGVLYLYHSADAGTTRRLIDQVTMPADTVSTTDPGASVSFSKYSETAPLRLAASDRLYVGCSIAVTDGVVFRAEQSDF
jgi:hypothetical protein